MSVWVFAIKLCALCWMRTDSLFLRINVSELINDIFITYIFVYIIFNRDHMVLK